MLSQFARANSSLFRTTARSFGTQLLHVTDVEGTDFGMRVFQNNRIVGVDADKGLFFKNTPGIPHLIYGGDVTDRGRHDLELTEMLVDFKRRYPTQVYLLVGNREIKNTRLAIELHPDTIRERLTKTKSPFWLTKPTSPIDDVLAAMRTLGKFDEVNPTPDAIERFLKTLSTEQCQLIYLKWMLTKTMGSPNTFRFRGDELGTRTSQQAISEIAILKSFIKESQPDGLMGQYLQLADIGVIVPNTGIIAVHGGLTSDNIGRVPDMKPSDKPIEDASTWISELNRWYKQQIHRWKERVNAVTAVFTQPGETPLDKSVLPVKGMKKYVMTADMLNESRQLVNIPHDVNEYLRKNDINIVLTGHQPIGDHPCIIRSDNALFINGDTGYAIGPKNPEDTRGSTIHTLEISADRQGADVNIHATLSDNTTLQTQFEVSPQSINGDSHIGTLLSDNYLVQCKLPNGDYRLIQQNGFDVQYKTVSCEEIASLQPKRVEMK